MCDFRNELFLILLYPIKPPITNQRDGYRFQQKSWCHIIDKSTQQCFYYHHSYGQFPVTSQKEGYDKGCDS